MNLLKITISVFSASIILISCQNQEMTEELRKEDNEKIMDGVKEKLEELKDSMETFCDNYIDSLAKIMRSTPPAQKTTPEPPKKEIQEGQKLEKKQKPKGNLMKGDNPAKNPKSDP